MALTEKEEDSVVIAVDLGGTHLRVGAVDAEGRTSLQAREKSESDRGSQSVLNRVSEAILRTADILQKQKRAIRGVSLGFPGIVALNGVIHHSPHFPDWKDLDVLGFFKTLPWPVLLDNDANLAAQGEAWKGIGRGKRHFVMMTLGTGVGGGLFLENKIFRGDRGFSGEIGHLCLDSEGPRCACGSRGCLEMFVSSQGILKNIETTSDLEGRENFLSRFGKVLGQATVKDLHEAAQEGDPFSQRIFKEMGFFLGIGIASLTNALGVDCFILGGGVAQAWDFFIEFARNEMAKRTYPETARGVQIERSLLGDEAALVGGGACFFMKPTIANEGL